MMTNEVLIEKLEDMGFEYESNIIGWEMNLVHNDIHFNVSCYDGDPILSINKDEIGYPYRISNDTIFEEIEKYIK